MSDVDLTDSNQRFLPGERITRREALKRIGMTGTTLVIASAAGPLLAACGGDDKAATPGTAGAQPTAGPTTATNAGGGKFTGNATVTEWGFGTDNTLAKSRVDAFTKEYPNIKLEIVPELEDQKIFTAVASGDVPDILWLGRDSIGGWAARGALEPLDDLIGKGGLDMNGFYPSAQSQVKYNNQTWAVPQFIDVRPFWVNLDPLQKAGIKLEDVEKADWNKLREYGVKLTDKQGSKIKRWGFDTKAQDGYFWMYAWGNGGELLSPDGKTVTFDDAKNVEALQYVVDTMQAQGGRQAHKAFADTWGWDAQHPFIQNQTAMTPYESWLLGMVAKFAPKHNFAVIPFKGKDGKPVSLTGGNAWAIPKGAKNKDAAWEFIKYMSALDTWRIGAKAVKAENATKGAPYIPSLSGNEQIDRTIQQEFYESIDPKFDKVVKLYPDLLKVSRSIPPSPVAKELNDILTNEGVNPALLGTKSPADALKAAQAKAEQAVSNFK